MNWPEIDFGDNFVGLLIDGVEDTPYVGGAFRMESPRGVVVEVPYLSRHASSQFEAVDQWFSDQSLPSNMIMRGPEGAVSMFDVEWSGHSEAWGGAKASVGRLRPREVVVAYREGAISDPLLLAEVHSYIDGLSRWVGASALSTDSETDAAGRVQSVSIRMEGGSVLAWSQGAARLELTSHWTHTPSRDGVSSTTVLSDVVKLISTFEDGPRAFWDHFVEQRKVATLLVFVFGQPISFRRHQIRDERFPARTGGGGEIYEVPLRELISNRTIRERAKPVLGNDDLGRPLVPFAALGEEGLELWSQRYDQWSRFVLPSAGVLGRRGAFVEDVVISTSMSLEAAGHLLGAVTGEEGSHFRGRPTTATFAYRCIRHLGLTWPPEIASEIGLARAIAKNYNDLKHADRGDFPDQVITWLISQVNRFLVRGIAMTIALPVERIREALQQSIEMSRLAELFNQNGMSVDERGKWTRA